jgi:hypothetical protein
MEVCGKVEVQLHYIHTYIQIQAWGTASTSNIEILELFQSKALRMIVNTPWYVPNTVIRRDLQTPRVKEEIRLQLSNSKPHWVTRQQAIAKTPAKWSAYQIPGVIVVFVILVCKFYSQKPQEALNLLVTEESYWALFYMSLYTCSYTICWM